VKRQLLFFGLISLMVLSSAKYQVYAQTVIPDNSLSLPSLWLPNSAGGNFAITPMANDEEYSDFTTEQRVGAGFLNILLGLGSYTMGDTLGGIIITLLEGGGIAMISFVVLSGMDPLADETNAQFVGMGAGLIIGSIIGGFIRPFQYHKPVRVAMIPGRDGVEQVQVSYTLRF